MDEGPDSPPEPAWSVSSTPTKIPVREALLTYFDEFLNICITLKFKWLDKVHLFVGSLVIDRCNLFCKLLTTKNIIKANTLIVSNKIEIAKKFIGANN